jgi:hypothetical protein
MSRFKIKKYPDQFFDHLARKIRSLATVQRNEKVSRAISEID